MQGVKNIIFDLGGVIINLNQELTFLAFKNLFPHQFNKIETQLKQDSWVEKFETGEVSQTQFLNFFQNYNNQITTEQIVDAWNMMLLNIPIERITLIKQLSKKYNIYLLSNTNSIHLESINNYVNSTFKFKSLDELFIKAYYSHQIELRKPNKAIFEFVLKDANLLPEETLFIDDSVEHTESAKALRIKTYHLNLKENEHIITLFQ